MISNWCSGYPPWGKAPRPSALPKIAKHKEIYLNYKTAKSMIDCRLTFIIILVDIVGFSLSQKLQLAE